MVLSRVFFYALVVLLLSSNAKCEDTYDIPVTFNPLIQSSVELGSTTKYFYDKDKPFYSKVTVIDAAADSETRVTDTIRKAITVVFLTTVSSHISKSLELHDLRYIKKSKWSYTLKVQSIVDASGGDINKITDKTIIYQIQENAIKVLEKRYQFNVDGILSELGLTIMEFYGVDEQQWIKVVGIITRKIINNRLTVLNLTSCYLAEMVNKTVTEMQAFTLNEVDEYLYNTSMLLDKLPAFQKTVVSSLYQTFNTSEEQLATMSDTDIAVINTKNLIDVLQLLTKSVLDELRVTVTQITESDSSFEEEMLLSCTDKWEPFRNLVISISFDNAAKNMSITSQKLASLINFSYTDIKNFTINQMLHVLYELIEPLQKDKKLVETSVLSDVVSLHGTQKLNIKEDNAFAAIEIFTIYTQRQLTLLYGWTQQDYKFASMYPLDDLNNVCSIKSDDYNLLELATINVGQVGNNFQCKSFNTLRDIWEKKSVRTLEEKFGRLFSLDKSISTAVSLLTNAPSPINYRVLNITSKTQELIEEITFNNISSVTTYSNLDLKTMSFQDIIVLAVHLKQNGSFDHNVTVVSVSIITVLTPSLLIVPTNIISNTSKLHITESVQFNATSPLRNASYSKSISAYQNLTTLPIDYWPSSRLLSPTIISTSTHAQTSLVDTSSFKNQHINTETVNTQLSKTTNISQPISARENLTSISSSPYLDFSNFTAALSSNLPDSIRSSFEEKVSNTKMDHTVSSTHQSNPFLKSTTILNPNMSFSISDSNQNISSYTRMNSMNMKTPTLVSSNYVSKNTTASKTQYLTSTSTGQSNQSHMFVYTTDLNAYPSKTILAQPITESLESVSLQISLPSTTSVIYKNFNTTKAQSFTDNQLTVPSPTVMTENLTKTIQSHALTPSLVYLTTTKTIISISNKQLNTNSVANSTTVTVNRAIENSSPADGIAASSNGENDMSTSVSPSSSLPTMISLVMQTTDVKSIIHSSIRSSTSVLGTPTMATVQSSTPLFVPASKPSTAIVNGIIKMSSDTPTSSDFPSGISRTVSNPYLKTSSSVQNITTVLTSILPMSSPPVLLSSVIINVTASVQQNASIPVTSSSTISNTANNSTRSSNKDDVPWIIYVVIAIMVVLIVFLIVVIIYCEKKHKKKHRPQVLDFHNGGINMYPRSTSYLAPTPESEADLADGLGIVNRHGPPPNMVTFNPTPEEKRELDLQHGQPGMLLSFKRIDPA